MRRWKKLVWYICMACSILGCEHKDLCYHHPHHASVRIDVDWSGFEQEVPTGMTVMVYPLAGGEAVNHLTNTITHATLNLPAGKYHTIVYNQSHSEFGSVSFRGMDRYETAEVYTNTVVSKWYKAKTRDERVATEPEWIGTDRVEDVEVTSEMVERTGEYLLQSRQSIPPFVIATHEPENIIHTIHIRINVQGIHNLRSARASLAGLAEGFRFSTGKSTTSVITQLVEGWQLTVDETDPTRGYLSAKITCFGLPSNHGGTSGENELILSLLLVDNKTVLDFPFSVGDKFEWVDRDNLELKLELTLDGVLPDVEPEGGSGGGFDAVVEDWGEEENVDINL